MPTCLITFLFTSLKKGRFFAVFLVFPFFSSAQTLTGLWTGALSNDSATARKEQSFEIALTEYRGKVSGYSRSEFIVDDTLYYIVKRVKGIIDGDICEVIDDEIISYNFRGKIDKGVKVTSTFKRNRQDSTWYLAGTWKTNATKKYYSVTGKLNLDEEKDLAASKIFPHLEELNLADKIAFYKERKEGAPIAKLARPEKVRSEYYSKLGKENPGTVVTITPPGLQKAEVKQTIHPVTEQSTAVINTTNDTQPVTINSDHEEISISTIKKPGAELPKSDVQKIETSSTGLNPSNSSKTIANNKVPPAKPINSTVGSQAAIKQETRTRVKPLMPKLDTNNTIAQNKPNATVTPVQQKQDLVQKPVSKPDPTVSNSDVADKNQEIHVNGPVPQVKKDPVDIIAKAAIIAGRKSEFSQMVSFKSDSLTLALYDNGEIDGDTVSIYMNGEVILSKQGLKSSAIKKTIYITPGNEEFTLVLFAENLGKYPPNTGLLVVRDGEDIYNLRFSSDFQKNAGIVFRRKK
jgi:hypothetical protein